jgi:hypothetical protein
MTDPFERKAFALSDVAKAVEEGWQFAERPEGIIGDHTLVPMRRLKPEHAKRKWDGKTAFPLWSEDME